MDKGSPRRRTLWELEESTRRSSGLQTTALLLLDAVIPLGTLLLVAVLTINNLASGHPVPAVVLGVSGGVLAVTLIDVFSVPWVAKAMSVNVMRQVDARLATVDESSQLSSVLEDMVLASGLPTTPRVWVIESDSVNALASSSSSSSSNIAVTQGLLGSLSEAQMRVVIAHLVARIASGDILRGTVISDVSAGSLLDGLSPLRRSARRQFSPEAHSELSTRTGDIGALFLLRDPGALTGTIEHISNQDTVLGDWALPVGHLFFTWPYTQSGRMSGSGIRRVLELSATSGVAEEPYAQSVSA